MYYYNAKFERITVNQLLDISHQGSINKNWGQDSTIGKDDSPNDRLQTLNDEKLSCIRSQIKTIKSQHSSKYSQSKQELNKIIIPRENKMGHFFRDLKNEKFQPEEIESEIECLQNVSPLKFIKLIKNESHYSIDKSHYKPKQSFNYQNDRSISQEIAAKRQQKCLTSLMTPYNLEEKTRYLLSKRRNYSLSLLEFQKSQRNSKSPPKKIQKQKISDHHNQKTLYNDKVISQNFNVYGVNSYKSKQSNANKIKGSSIQENKNIFNMFECDKQIFSTNKKQQQHQNMTIQDINSQKMQDRSNRIKGIMSSSVGTVKNYSFKRMHYKRLRKKQEMDGFQISQKNVKINLSHKCQTQMVNHNLKQTKQLFSQRLCT